MAAKQYEPLTKCSCTNTWISYIKSQGWRTDGLYEGLKFDESFMSDVENWMPTDEVYRLAKNITSSFPDIPHLFFDMAVWAADHRTVGPLQTIVASYLNPGFVYDRLPAYIGNLNKHRKIQIVERTKNRACIDTYHMTEVRAIREVCEWTRGLIAVVPLVLKLPLAEVTETLCEVRGGECCQYEVTWINRGSVLRTLWTKTFGLAKMVEEQRLALESSQERLLLRFEELNRAKKIIEDHAKNLELKVQERTKELREIQIKLVEVERRSLEHRITGGFAHEMRNALAGAQLELKATLKYRDTGRLTLQVLKDSVTSLLSNISALHEKYHIPREEIAELLIPEIKTIAEIADHLSETISGMAKDIDRGLSITNQIREYAKLSELQPGHTLIHLVPFLKELGHRYRQDFERIGIRYSAEGLESVIVKAEEIHLDSIFSNLIINARDALAEHDGKDKEIRVTVERNREENGNWVVIRVADNGPGIPPEHQSEIFEPFFSTKPSSGTGFGLGIVKRLVQLYGGLVTANSKQNERTDFIVTLPL